MGNPDLPTPPHIIDKLVEAASKRRNHRYSASRGIRRLRRAICNWYRRRYDVTWTPKPRPSSPSAPRRGSRISAGAPPARRHGPGAEPGYPIHPFGRDRRRRPAPCADGAREWTSSRSWRRPSALAWPRPKVLLINFPHNPTTEVVEPRSSSGWSSSRASTASGSCTTWPMPTSSSTATARRRSCRRRAPRTSPSSSSRCRRLQHAGLAGWLHCREPGDGDGAGEAQVLPRLRHLHADPGGRDRRPRRPAGLSRRDPRVVPQTPQRPVRRSRQHRLARRETARDDVRLGADPGAFRRLGSLEFAKMLLPRPRSPCRRASVSATSATASYASRSSRTSTAPARRSAGSGACEKQNRASRSKARRRVRPEGATRVGQIGSGRSGRGRRRCARTARQIGRRAGRAIEITGVSVRDLDKPRAGLALERHGRSPPTRPRSSTTRRSSVVVELIGGLEPARTLVLRAIQHGKHVVTANKALIAIHGDGARSRRPSGAASCSASRPRSRAASRSSGPSGRVWPANRIVSLYGIVNGTVQLHPDPDDAEGARFRRRPTRGAAPGYAEADPTLDVEGIDSAHKLTILAVARLRDRAASSTGSTPRASPGSAPSDIAYARELGYRIKLLAIAKARTGRHRGSRPSRP